MLTYKKIKIKTKTKTKTKTKNKNISKGEKGIDRGSKERVPGGLAGMFASCARLFRRRQWHAH